MCFIPSFLLCISGCKCGCSRAWHGAVHFQVETFTHWGIALWLILLTLSYIKSQRADPNQGWIQGGGGGGGGDEG